MYAPAGVFEHLPIAALSCPHCHLRHRADDGCSGAAVRAARQRQQEAGSTAARGGHRFRALSICRQPLVIAFAGGASRSHSPDRLLTGCGCASCEEPHLRLR